MSFLDKTDVKNHLRPPFLTNNHLVPPDALDISAVEPEAIATEPSFADDFVAEHSAIGVPVPPVDPVDASFSPQVSTTIKSAQA